jgi:hypothetical protein
MGEYPRGLKRKLGAVLLKIKQSDYGFNEEEWQLAKVLEGKGLAKFFGPDPGPKIMSSQEYANHVQMAALSHYMLTGLGQEFVLKHTEQNLLRDRFLLPSEMPWYDQWPWKLIWPAIVSIATTLVIYAIKGNPPK